MNHKDWYKQYRDSHDYKGVDAYYKSHKAFQEGNTDLLDEMMKGGNHRTKVINIFDRG